MTTTTNTTSIAYAAHSLYGYTRNILWDELNNDGSPVEAAKLLRRQIQLAWEKALADVGMPEDTITKLRL